MISVAMLERLNQRSKDHMRSYTLNIKQRLEEKGLSHEDVTSLVGNPPALVLTSEDFEKKRRVRTAIPYYERCSGKKADSEQCTRRRQSGSLFCGTHVKGTPYGQVSDCEAVSDKIVVHAQEVAGIVHWVDDGGNVYSQEDVYQRLKDPRVIAKFALVDGVPTILRD